jgi:hypothetical protein
LNFLAAFGIADGDFHRDGVFVRALSGPNRFARSGIPAASVGCPALPARPPIINVTTS